MLIVHRLGMFTAMAMLVAGSGCRSEQDLPAVAADGSTGEQSTGAVEPADVDSDDAGETGAHRDTSNADASDDGASSGTTGDGPQVTEPTPWVWSLPTGFPDPYVPEDNPMTVEKVELGRHLFYDTRLSGNGTFSCASCHQQASAFTDGRGQALGSTGELHPRGSMSLANVAYASTLAWGNPDLIDLEVHALGPMFGDDPVELGLADEAAPIAAIADDPRYQELFDAAYPHDGDDAMTLDHIVQSIASFQRTLISGSAPFDRWFFESDESAISASAKRGWELFNFPGECTYCHFNFNFSDSTYFPALPERTAAFHNTGLYNVDGEGAYPESNEGLYNFTGKAEDMGKFKSPTLRNIALTAPYMHDGSLETLEDVLEHYALGGRVDTPHADFQMTTFELTPQMLEDFQAFFDSLTDDSFLTDPAFSDPWASAPDRDDR